MSRTYLYQHASEPKAGAECYEACWSEGRSCRTCGHKCYRAGWAKARVDADNRRRVAESQNPAGQNTDSSGS